MAIDHIVAVVAVEPGPASAEDIAFAAGGGMTAEPVGVTATSVLGDGVEIPVDIAVQYEVVGTAKQVEADGHPIVHA